MIPFQKYEQFLEQGKKHDEIRAKYNERVQTTGQRVNDLRAELEAVFRREFSEGVDLSADKTRLRKKIDEAEKEFEMATEEQRKMNEYLRDQSELDRITVRDVIMDWRTNYRPLVRKERLDPIIERMKRAKEEYLNAVVDFVELREEYRLFHSEIHELAYSDNASHPGDHMYPDVIAHERDLPIITDAELYLLQSRGQWPVGMVRKPIGGGSNE